MSEAVSKKQKLPTLLSRDLDEFKRLHAVGFSAPLPDLTTVTTLVAAAPSCDTVGP